jgi:hypothetical protein
MGRALSVIGSLDDVRSIAPARLVKLSGELAGFFEIIITPIV